MDDDATGTPEDRPGPVGDFLLDDEDPDEVRSEQRLDTGIRDDDEPEDDG